MCFLRLHLVTFNQFLFHKLVQPPLVGISYSQAHILQKAVSGTYCPLCWEQTLFVSLELGLNLLMCLRDCTGRGCVGVKPILTTLCHRLCNISQISVNLPFSRLQSQFTQQSPMEDVSHLWSLFCFDSFLVLTYLPSPFWQDQTCTCVQDVGKTWIQRGTTTASLLFSAPFPKQP